jgi:hypothetical protein
MTDAIVTQEDRADAYALMLKIGRVSPLYEAAIMAGEWDHCEEVQAFAMHRIKAALAMQEAAINAVTCNGTGVRHFEQIIADSIRAIDPRNLEVPE